MGLSRYQRCLNLLREYVKKNKKNYIYRVPLRGLIARELGSDERSIFLNLNIMKEQGIITETTLNKWEITLPDDTEN